MSRGWGRVYRASNGRRSFTTSTNQTACCDGTRLCYGKGPRKSTENRRDSWEEVLP